MSQHVDIVVPCYNEEKCIDLFYNEIKKAMSVTPDYTYNIIFIDDGSTDNTLTEIKELAYMDDITVRYISFARNFGKESAIYAGLVASKGAFVVLMDVDLQDPPELIPKMLLAIEDGYDCCAARRVNRVGEPAVRSFFANSFYKLMNKISFVKMEPGARDFRLMTRKVVDAILGMSERERFTKGLMSWVGFNTKWFDYNNIERAAGTTKWSFYRLFKYAVSGITAFSTAPLRIATVVGLLVVMGTFIYALYMGILAIFWGRDVPGYVSLLTIMIFLCGIIILLLGIIGEYLARVYLEVKRRPIYIAKESNFEEVKNQLDTL